MKVGEFVRKISRYSDDFPVEIRWGSQILATDNSICHYADNGDLPEFGRTIRSIVIGESLIIIYVK